MVFGTEGDDWSITALPGSTDVMNDSRASLSVSKVYAKDAPEICKFSKMFFLGFSCHFSYSYIRQQDLQGDLE